MTLPQLIAELHRRRIQLDAWDGKLRFRPTDRVDDDLRSHLKEHKQELFYLATHDDPRLQLLWFLAIDLVGAQGGLSGDQGRQLKRADVSWAAPEPAESQRLPGRSDTWCSECGAAEWKDTVLNHDPHRGRSSRRDCKRCGAFKEFPRWYVLDE